MLYSKEEAVFLLDEVLQSFLEFRVPKLKNSDGINKDDLLVVSDGHDETDTEVSSLQPLSDEQKKKCREVAMQLNRRAEELSSRIILKADSQDHKWTAQSEGYSKKEWQVVQNISSSDISIQRLGELLCQCFTPKTLTYALAYIIEHASGPQSVIMIPELAAILCGLNLTPQVFNWGRNIFRSYMGRQIGNRISEQGLDAFQNVLENV